MGLESISNVEGLGQVDPEGPSLGIPARHELGAVVMWQEEALSFPLLSWSVSASYCLHYRVLGRFMENNFLF